MGCRLVLFSCLFKFFFSPLIASNIRRIVRSTYLDTLILHTQMIYDNIYALIVPALPSHLITDKMITISKTVIQRTRDTTSMREILLGDTQTARKGKRSACNARGGGEKEDREHVLLSFLCTPHRLYNATISMFCLDTLEECLFFFFSFPGLPQSRVGLLNHEPPHSQREHKKK